MPQAAAITPTFWFGFVVILVVVIFLFLEQRKGKKEKKGKKKNLSLRCLTLSAHVCAYAPLFLISTLCAFLPSGVVIPNSTSLPPEISSDSSHLCHQLLPVPAVQAPKPGHQAGAACGQTGHRLPGHTLPSPSNRHLMTPGSSATLQQCPGTASRARTNQGETNCSEPSRAAASLTPWPSLTAPSMQLWGAPPQTSKCLIAAPSLKEHFRHCPPLCRRERVSHPVSSGCFLQAGDGYQAAQPTHSHEIFCVSADFFTLKL